MRYSHIVKVTQYCKKTDSVKTKRYPFLSKYNAERKVFDVLDKWEALRNGKKPKVTIEAAV